MFTRAPPIFLSFEFCVKHFCRKVLGKSATWPGIHERLRSREAMGPYSTSMTWSMPPWNKFLSVCYACGHAIARLGYRRMFAVTQSFAKRLWWILNVKSIFFLNSKSGSYKKKVVASGEVSFLLFPPSKAIVYHMDPAIEGRGRWGAGHQKY